MRIRYRQWDGTQQLGDLDADDLLGAMSDGLMADGDLWSALRRLLQQGIRNPEGAQMPGLQEMREQLKRRRQQQLDRYDLGTALEDIKKKLAEVQKTEREGIQRRLDEAGERVAKGEMPEDIRRQLAEMAAQRKGALDKLPEDPAGQIRDLQKYEFMDPDAHRQFWDLLRSLRQQMLQPFLQGMQQAMQNMTPEDMARMREMLSDLNRMLRDRAQGKDPNFQAFKDKWGQFFPGAENLDQLLEQMRRQMAQMQSLMQSMSGEQ